MSRGPPFFGYPFKKRRDQSFGTNSIAIAVAEVAEMMGLKVLNRCRMQGTLIRGVRWTSAALNGTSAEWAHTSFRRSSDSQGGTSASGIRRLPENLGRL